MSLIETIHRLADPASLIARANVYSLNACLDRYEAMLEAVLLRPRGMALAGVEAERTT